MVFIRKENPNDYPKVFNLIKSAFEEAIHTDNDEHNLVERLRKSDSFIPALSLVAEIDGEIVGYILFTEVKVGNSTQLALAPLAVSPAFQKKGIGGKLIIEGHSIAKELGYEYSILLGHPSYYPKFGYTPASNFGISPPFEVADDVFMAINLHNRATVIKGIVEYPKEFFLLFKT